MACCQCDQFGQFIALWITFQSLWYQLFCQNCPHFKAIFVKLSKSLIFPVKSFLGNFYRHLATFYWSHCLLLASLPLDYPLLAEIRATIRKWGGKKGREFLYSIDREREREREIGRKSGGSHHAEWPDAQLKSSPNCSKSCPKSNCSC